MKTFKDLQARHEELINKAQTNENVLVQAQELIVEINKESSHISSLNERDQLRANLRFWASYVYEKSGIYPNVDLLPSANLPRPGWMIPSIVGVIVVSIMLLWGAFVKQQQAALSSQTAQVNPQSSVTPKASTTALVISTSTPSAIPSEILPTPTKIEIPQAGSLSIEITSVREGDEVQPITVLRGTYSNLPFGYSVHVVVKSLSMEGIFFPMKQFAAVAPNSSTGTWEIEGRFGQGSDLQKSEEYQIQLVAAMNDDARQALLKAIDTGIQELPSGVIEFPQTITVKRPAIADFVDGARLVYSSFLDDEGNYEIFTAQLDGSDIRRITYTSGFNEYFPSLSPNGKQIVYVGRRVDENNIGVHTIDVMNSDGTEIETIVQNQSDVTYDSPLWSSDGEYIAYASGTPRSKPVSWNIMIYDVKKKRSFLVASSKATTSRYFSWIPKTNEIVFSSLVPQTNTSGFVKVDIQKPDEVMPYYDSNKEEFHPAISPNGKLLAFVRLDKTGENIYVLDLATDNIVQLTTGDAVGGSPAWSLDGKTVFFETSMTTPITIWSINIDGSKLTQVTFEKDRFPFVGFMYALIPK